MCSIPGPTYSYPHPKTATAESAGIRREREWVSHSKTEANEQNLNEWSVNSIRIWQTYFKAELEAAVVF